MNNYNIMNAQTPFIVALAGGSGSGKTTLSKIITSSLPWDVTVVPLDQFYKDVTHLPMAERKKINFDVPESLDMDLACQAIYNLAHGRDTNIPVYDFAANNRSTKTQLLHPNPVILFEGMHTLFHKPLLELYDLSVFLDIDEQTRLQRKIERDIAERGRDYKSVLEMWKNYTQPMHDIYVQPTNVRADLRFTDTFTPQVIRVVTDTIQQKINLKLNVFSVMPV